MADLPISGLPAATVLNNPDLIAIEQSGVTKNLTGADLITSIGGGFTFSGLDDVDAPYSEAGALTKVNDLESGMDESTTLLTKPAVNTFRITEGTSYLQNSGITNIQGDLTVSPLKFLSVTESCTINQDLSSTSTPTLAALTLSNSPLAGSDATRKDYVDSLVNGLSWKNPVVASTTVDITRSGEQMIDMVSVVTGDRVLVQFQTLPENNGIYIVDAGLWTRSTDMDEPKEFVSAALTVSQGATYAGMSFTCTNGTPPNIGTTPITFVCFSGIINHNGTVGLQGGLGNTEYWHLKTSAYDNLLDQDQPLKTTDSPTFVGGTLSGLTQGSVPFIGSGGLISEDNANLFWDNANKELEIEDGGIRIGVGTSIGGVNRSLIVGTTNNAISGNNFAAGNNVTAQGLSAGGIGSFISAEGTSSFCCGKNTSTFGNNAFAGGEFTIAESFDSAVFGRWMNLQQLVSPFIVPNKIAWVDTDRLFVIGNGDDNLNRSDALVILKNGAFTVPSVISGLVRSTSGLLAGGATVDLASEVTGTLPIGSVSVISGITGLATGTGTNLQLTTSDYVDQAITANNPFLHDLTSTEFSWDVSETRMSIGTLTGSYLGTLAVVGPDVAATVGLEVNKMTLRNCFGSEPKDSAADFILTRWRATVNNRPYTRLDIKLSDEVDDDSPTKLLLTLRGDNRIGFNTTTPLESLHIVGIASGNRGAGGILSQSQNIIGDGDTLNLGAGLRFHWYTNKGAFRAGLAGATSWDNANIGNYSVAFGNDTFANGAQSFAMGDASSAMGANSSAFGEGTDANGKNSASFGNLATATGIDSFASGKSNLVNASQAFVQGINNSNISFASAYFGRFPNIPGDGTPVSSKIAWAPIDPLFVIANGASGGSTANALTMLKNGSTILGGTTPDTSSLLDLTSTTLGFLPPRGTQAQRNAIPTPAEGLLFYNTDQNSPNFYNGLIWKDVSVGGVFSQIVSASAINTLDEISLISTGVGSVVIPGNSAIIGTTYRLSAFGTGEWQNNDNLTIKVKLGATEILSDTLVLKAMPATGRWKAEVQFSFRDIGLMADLRTNIAFTYNDSQGVDGEFQTIAVGNAVDSTINQTVDFTVQWGTNSDNITADFLVLEKVF